jgi:hypothetical protein
MVVSHGDLFPMPPLDTSPACAGAPRCGAPRRCRISPWYCTAADTPTGADHTSQPRHKVAAVTLPGVDRARTTPVALFGVAAALIMVACGGSGTTTPTAGSSTTAPTTAPTAAPTSSTGTSLTCPSASAVGTAFGHTYAAPISRPSTNNPAGDSGVSCEYLEQSPISITILAIGTGPVSVPFIARTEAAEKKAALAQHVTLTISSVSGLGTEAAILTFSKASVVTEDDLLAYSGTTGVSILVNPAASDSQLEAFAHQLLG